MKIGYSVEGSTDRALLQGLKHRWCPEAEMIEGKFRGTSGISQTREIPNTCLELQAKGANLMVFLRDANNEPWRRVRQADQDRCRPEHKHLAVFGVCNRNVECWICLDADWLAQRTGRPADDFRVNDPKGVFESGMGISSQDRKEEEIANLMVKAPLQRWLAEKSFEAFYDDLRDLSKKNGCEIENLRQSR